MKKKYYDKIHRVNCLSSDLEAIYHQAARRFGMSDSVMYVLYMIHEKGEDCLLYDICKETGISKQTINSAVRKLEKDEIIYLEPYNGRTKKLCLTDKGKSYVNQTVARLFDAECNAFNEWTEDEINLYLNLMEKYNTSLRKQIEIL